MVVKHTSLHGAQQLIIVLRCLLAAALGMQPVVRPKQLAVLAFPQEVLVVKLQAAEDLLIFLDLQRLKLDSGGEGEAGRE